MRDGWKSVRLGDVCTFKPPKKEARQKLGAEDPVSFVPMNNLKVRMKSLELNEERALGKVAGSYTYFADGDVLLAKITPCFENGKLGIASGLTNGVGFGSSEFIVMRPNEELDAEYLFYFLSQDNVRDAGARVMSGAVGHKRVPKEFVEGLQLPLPSAAKQKRIIAILDEAFEGIDTVVANTEKNLANARELLDSTSLKLFEAVGDRQKFTLQQLMELGWITGHLDGNHGSDYPRKSEFVSEGVPYISANCIKSEAVDFSLAKYLSHDRASGLRKGVARNRDVLFAHNATVGPVAMLYTDLDKVVLSTSLTYYRCNDNHIFPEYLANYMRTPLFKHQYQAVMTQSTRNQVPITKQREFYHLIPSLEEQKTIAGNLDVLRGDIERLTRTYRQKLTALAELKQSLLHKAFSGELTGREAEAAVEEATA